MSLATAIANDYRVWDGLESVTLTVRKNSGNTDSAIASAKRRVLRRSELAASAGRYVASDIVFLIPAVLLPNGVKPKMYDQIIDADAIAYTILEPSEQTLRTIWRCVCRNLIIHHDLQQLLDVYRPQKRQGQDVAGNREPAFMPYRSNVPCRFQEQSRQLVDFMGKKVTEVRYDVFVIDTIDITHEDQIRSGGKTYDVTGITYADRMDEASRIQVVWRF